MVVGESKRANIMDGIENTGDVRLHDHRLRLKQRFDIVRKLGQGTYGKVQLGINKKTGQEVAIKTIKKCKIESEADLIRIRREVQIMSSVRHPNIVHIYEVFENSEKMILVMEYCSGGELYDYLSQKKVFDEEEARRLFRQIATAVYYCHIHKICHRDLKLENVLLDDTGSAKIADFGLSNVFKETSLLSTFCGSPLYASPEIVKGTPYIGPEVDCWSLGVLLYTLVYGAMPFDGSNFKRLVRQISNGDYYEPKSPSSASPLIRDMLTVDPVKRADIAYICDHPWVNTGCETSCLEMAQALAAETPVRLDLLLSLAPAAPAHSASLVVPPEAGGLGAAESCTDLTSSASMAVEPSNSAEKRILDLVAEGGEDAIKPSPTRTIVSAGDNKRKLPASGSGLLDRKKERLASSANIAQPPVPEETAQESTAEPPMASEPTSPPTLKSSATITIQPSPPAPAAPLPAELVKDPTRTIKEQKEVKETPKETPKDEEVKEKTGAKPRGTVKKKISPAKSMEEKSPEKQEEPKEEPKPSSVATAADRLTSLSLTQPAANQVAAPKPKKLSIPGGNVGSFKEQFERRASLTAGEARRPKPAVSKIAKPKAQSEDREVPKAEPGTVRLQQIGIEPSQTQTEDPHRGGVKKTESEPSHSSAVDPSVLLQDARRSLQNSMAKLVEEKQGEDRRRARDIISSAIRTGMSQPTQRGKPPVPYGRSSSAGVTSLTSPPGTPPAPAAAPRVFRTEAQHRVEDHRNRGVSVERIIPINLPAEEPTSPPPKPVAAPAAPAPRAAQPPLRRLVSTESSTSEPGGGPGGEPIKKSAREFIIPIAVEGKGFVTPRQRSLEPEAAPRLATSRAPKPRRISSLVSGGESEEEDDSHMHRLRSSRAARAESVSSGEEDEEDEGFHLLTAENLFSTLLHRVRALTNRLNGEEGPGFPQNPHSLFNNLHQSPFFNSPHLPRRSLLREGWGTRDLHADFDSMFNKARPLPRGNSKKGKKGEGDKAATGAEAGLDLGALELSAREARALSGLTPALARRLQRQLLAHLPPAAASTLRRTLSLHSPAPPDAASPEPHTLQDDTELASQQFCTLPRKRATKSREASPPGERPLLRKYLTPERSLEDAASDGGGAASEPPAPRKRISRFLRSDFFDTPPDENVLAKHKKEKELETQKVLREIREKRNKSAEGAAARGVEPDADGSARKCLSPIGALVGKDRSRSNTPFFPILDNIKENALDSALSLSGSRRYTKSDDIKQKYLSEDAKESKLSRPKSFPVKNRDSFDEPVESTEDNISNKENEVKEKSALRESKLIRPKSYPTSSPSPEKVFVSRNMKKDETKSAHVNDVKDTEILDSKNDVEVSFSITLPKKSARSVGSSKIDTLRKSVSLDKEDTRVENKKIAESTASGSSKLDTLRKSVSLDKEDTKIDSSKKLAEGTLTLRRYQVVKSNIDEKPDNKDTNKTENGSAFMNGVTADTTSDINNPISKTVASKTDTSKSKSSESETTDKKGTIKKKIIKKVSSKPKTDTGNPEGTDTKATTEKKKVTKKVKKDEKNAEEGAKTTGTKKKSMLQSIGHKLEKLASNKSSSPEKASENNSTSEAKSIKLSRTQREQSVPVSAEPPTESNLIKRAVTLTDVAALETQNTTPSKTTVSKVLGLFRKFEPKEKISKQSSVEKSSSENIKAAMETVNGKSDLHSESAPDLEGDRPRRPTSLLLNGLGRKAKNGKTTNDCVSSVNQDNVDDDSTKTTKNIRNSLKLDFSRLPRVKKIVPTNPVIEPQLMDVSSEVKEERRDVNKNGVATEEISKWRADSGDSLGRSRSRSRSTFSNCELRSENSAEVKYFDRHPLSPPLRNHEPTSPDKEDVVDRIRRKSFYSRFNEKKQRRKSSLVGPGAAEYDPLARIHGPRDASPLASPLSPHSPAYDLAPYSLPAADLSPSDRYRSLLTDLPRTSHRYDYGLNDKLDTYRSLDRTEFRKYPTRSYLDYDQPSYASHRYSRTKSLLDSSDGLDEHSLGARDPHKYGRTISMYAPGSYVTYRPKRTLNPAIILKESEKEPSPENILDKIRRRKNFSISVTRKPDFKDPLPRSDVAPQGESDGAERAPKAD